MFDVLLTLVLLAHAAPFQEPSADTKARFASALEKLQADEYEEREKATEEIAGLPDDAVALVESELRKDLPAETRSRLSQAYARLKGKAKRTLATRAKEAQHAWNTKTAIEAYEKVGRRNEKWDTPVRAALPMMVRIWEGAAGAQGQGRAAYDLFTEAVTAGCDDPLVLYGRARMYDLSIRKSYPEAVSLHIDAARAMKERGGKYHSLRQCLAFARAADFAARAKKDVSDEEKKQAQVWWDLALRALGEAASDPESPVAILRETSDLMIATELQVIGDRKVGLDKILEALEKARPGSTLPLVLKGAAYTQYAWDARGGGWANSVTADGWKKMAERLVEAERALTEAWKADPEDPEPPTLMLTVELGQGKGRPVMETWFRRAMAADPNNYKACSSKMYYLEPKWHGSPEAMLAFGRELLAAGNWEGRLPFQLVDAHWALSAYGEKREDYFKDPAVWKDLQSVYEPFLKKHPQSTWDRSFYAKYACYAGRWSEAQAQFDLLGDNVNVAAFKDKEEMDRLRREAAAKER